MLLKVPSRRLALRISAAGSDARQTPQHQLQSLLIRNKA
jgi:hypothetical protein